MKTHPARSFPYRLFLYRAPRTTPLVLLAASLAIPFSLTAQQQAPPTAAPKAEAKDQPDFVRYVKTDDSEELQTAAVRYTKEDQVVDLIAVVHLADEKYYKFLNGHLKKYDAVLYEMVGGEFKGRDEREVAPEMASIQMAQSMVQKMLGMDFQVDSIDYSAANFIHADVDWEQFEGLMASRNQSIGTLFQRAMSQAEGGSIPGLPTDEAGAQQLMNSVMSSLMSGNTADLKRVIAPVLGEAEAMITQLEGDDGTVIVTERNKVVMEVLDRELKKDNRSFAIFYGAGHMPDLEKQLLEVGFTRTAESWLTAWNIVDTPQDQRVNLMQELFSDPEMIQSLMSAVQEAMKQLQEVAPEAVK